MNIVADDNIITILCNGKKVPYIYKNGYYDYKYGEQIFVKLKKDKNSCKLSSINKNGIYTFYVKQKITFLDYFILFILFGFPILYFLNKLFFITVDKLYIPKKSLTYLPILILIIGILLRIIYFYTIDHNMFQHDLKGHQEFIKLLAQDWILPQGNKGLEYPQQHFYYLLAAVFYKVQLLIGFSENSSLHNIAYISLIGSIIFLIFSYKFVKLISNSFFVTNTLLVFTSLTPTLIYMTTRVNNDALVMPLAVATLYYLIRSYKSNFNKYFFTTLILTTVLFLTKISSATIELLFFVMLIFTYKENNNIKSKLFIFSFVGVFILGFTLLKAYIPVTGSFHFVNSASYINQTIEPLTLNYFTSFNFLELIEMGHSHVMGSDDIRYSFLTYQYGTMLFGEFDYVQFYEKSNYLMLIMQTIILLGLIFVLGFISYIVNIYKVSFLEKLLFLTLLLNFILILKFLFSYPSVCNTDFRYFLPSFILIGYFISKGIEYLQLSKPIKYTTTFLISILGIVEILYFVELFKVI